jgi:DNA-binding PadR family transcriptional regulator
VSNSDLATRAPASSLSLGDHAVLALLAERSRHGWAIVRELSPGGGVGRIWTLSRPLAYRAIDNLMAQRLVRATGTEPGDGPRRTILAATAAGRREVDRWLDTPVEHLREVRTELLLKLTFAERAGRSRRKLLRAQQRRFRSIFEALDRAARDADADLVDQWRRESAEAVRRFLAGALE